MKRRVSVIIPVDQNWERLKKCLLTYHAQTLKPVEILVVGFVSNKSIPEKLKVHFPKVKFISQKIDFGVTGALNAGTMAISSKSNFILFASSETQADKSMLQKLVKVAMVKKKAGIVCPTIKYMESGRTDSFSGLKIDTITGDVNLGLPKDTKDKAEAVDAACSVLLTRRGLIDEIGGFDNKYLNYHEDVDFCFNAKRLGYLTYCAPAAIAKTKKPKYLQGFDKGNYYATRNRFYFLGKHGKSFNSSLAFIPKYLLKNVRDSLLLNDTNSLGPILTGLKEALIKEVLIKRLMVGIPFSRLNVLKRTLGYGKMTMLDVGCGNGEVMEILNRNKSWKVDGIDIYPIDAGIARTTGVYSNVIVGDVRNLKKYFKTLRKKYDVVFCSQVLEHLEKDQALKLLSDMEELGKRVIAATPRGFLEKDEPYHDEGDNPYQIHRSSWSLEDYQNRGYRVYGRGVNFLFGDDGLLANSKKPPKILHLAGQALSLLLQSFVFYFPQYSTGLLAVKVNEKGKV